MCGCLSNAMFGRIVIKCKNENGSLKKKKVFVISAAKCSSPLHVALSSQGNLGHFSDMGLCFYCLAVDKVVNIYIYKICNKIEEVIWHQMQ